MSLSNWTNVDLGQCLCWDVASNDWCQSFHDQCEDYWNDKVPVLAPAIIVFALVMILAITYTVARCVKLCSTLTCCLVCGKMPCVDTASGAHSRLRGFDRATLLRGNMVAVLGFYLVFCIGTSVMWGKVNDRYKDADRILTAGRSAMPTIASKWAGEVESVAALIGYEEGTSWVVPQVTKDMTRWSNDIEDQQRNAKNLVASVHVFWWCIGCLFFAATTFTFFNIHRIAPEILFGITFIAVMCLIGVQGVTAGGGSVMDDACDDYGNVVDQVGAIMQSQLGCGGARLDTDFGRFAGLTDSLEQRYAQLASSPVDPVGDVQELCSSYFSCGSFGAQSSLDDFEDIFYTNSRLLVQNGDCSDAGNPCTIAQCAQRCTSGTEAQNRSKAAVDKFDQVYHNLKAARYTAEPVTSCAIFTGMIEAAQPAFCEGDERMERSLTITGNLEACCLFLCVVILFLTALGNYMYRVKGGAAGAGEAYANYSAYSPMSPPTMVATYGTPDNNINKA